MRKTDFITPDKQWLIEQFKSIPFGVMRPSEMETILSFFITYHNDNDIEETEEFLSQKYKITESKARRLKIEFATRYKKDKNVEEEIASIIAGLFLGSKVPFEYDRANKRVSFMIRDPYERKVLKQDLENKRILYTGDFNGKLIRLTQENFVHYMNLHSDNFEKQEKFTHIFSKITKEEQKRKSEFWMALEKEEKLKAILEKMSPVLKTIFSIGVGFIK